MHHLAGRGVPVPKPQTLLDGTRLTTLNGKPAAIVTRLSGGYEPEPGPAHCALAGQTLARAHLAARGLLPHPPAQPARPGLVEGHRARPDALSGHQPGRTAAPHPGRTDRLRHRRRPREAALQPGALRPVPRNGAVRRHLRIAPYGRLHRFLLRRLRHLAVRRGGQRQSTGASPPGDGGFSAPAPWKPGCRPPHAVRPFTEEERAAWPVMLARRPCASGFPACTTPTCPGRPRRSSRTTAPHFERILRLRTEQPAPALPRP